MEIPENLTYPELSDFLKGKTDLLKLKEFEKKTPVYGIFDFLQKSQRMQNSSHKNIDLTFTKAEEYLEKYLAGTLTKLDADELKRAILYSEKNFRKLNHLIKQHTLALAGYNDSFEYEKALSNKKILIRLQGLKDKKPDLTFNVYGKKIALGLVAIAAIFLLLIMLPFKINRNLDELYSFDKIVPLDYIDSTLRSTHPADEITNPDYKRFKYQFSRGMSEYLALEYARALAEWEGLEKDIAKLQSNPFFNEKDKGDFLLYNAICRIALYLSDNQNITESEKNRVINRSLELFKQLPLNSDAEKYYYALALGLTGRNIKAKEILRSLKSDSQYYNRKMLLEDQLNQ